MREIKFRAWDKQAQEMNYSGTLGSGSSADIISIEFNGNLNIQNAYGLDFGARNPSFDPPVDNFILMQFTGLTDKNGKEIYEGDVLTDGVNKVKVEFVDYSLQLRLVNLKQTKDGYVRTYDLASFSRCKNLEVIGNIHEHPHLLTPNN